MIRLILLVIGAFLVWVLFFSDFTRKQKIVICVSALLISIAGLWFEQAGQTPKEGLIAVDELVDCGVKAQHSYRTNYDIEICLNNTSSTASVKRVRITFAAMSCPEGECEEIQAVDKEFPLSLEPESSITLKQNLDFNKVDDSLEPLVWIAKVVSVRAIH